MQPLSHFYDFATPLAFTIFGNLKMICAMRLLVSKLQSRTLGRDLRREGSVSFPVDTIRLKIEPTFRFYNFVDSLSFVCFKWYAILLYRQGESRSILSASMSFLHMIWKVVDGLWYSGNDWCIQISL